MQPSSIDALGGRRARRGGGPHRVSSPRKRQEERQRYSCTGKDTAGRVQRRFWHCCRVLICAFSSSRIQWSRSGRWWWEVGPLLLHAPKSKGPSLGLIFPFIASYSTHQYFCAIKEQPPKGQRPGGFEIRNSNFKAKNRNPSGGLTPGGSCGAQGLQVGSTGPH